MADEKENKEEQTEEVKEKKEKKGLSTLTIILLVVGTLVINAVVVIGVVKFMMGGEESPDSHSEKPHSEEMHEGDDFSEFKDPEENFFEEEKQRHMMTTGRITTNPKNSISKFVVVELGLEYRIKEDAPSEEYTEDSALMQKLKIKIKSTVTQEVGSMTVEQIVRSRGDMDKKFKEALQPVFNENKIWLRDVYINEFMIQ